MGKSVGYHIVYPPGCKELNESLKVDELRRRLNDLSNSFDQIIEEESCEADSTYDPDSSTQPAQHENLKGLFLLLVSPEYTQHAAVDIQLRVGVCVCKLLKIFCPINPFSGMLEERSFTKNTLLFILACISQLSNVKSKSDITYPKLHTILYIDVFLWCASLEDEATLFECIKTVFTIVKNLNVWAWTEPTIIRQMLLDMVVKVVAQAESLLTPEIITYILELLIEPARTTQPEQHTFARDLIIRTTNQLEYHIQMLLQNALIAGGSEKAREPVRPVEPKPTSNGDVDISSDSDTNSEIHDPNRSNPLGEHTFLVIYALHTIQESLVAPNSSLHEKNPSLWEAFLGRFNDIDKEVRKLCVHMVPQLMKKNPDLPIDRLLTCFKQRAYDPEEDVRLLVLRLVANLVNESTDDVNESLFDLLKERSRDKDLAIRKEALTALATIYKRCLLSEQPSTEKLEAALNTILHMYYLPSVDDRVTVERLFKSSIVPYHLDTTGRVRALFICYKLLDEASIRAIQEMFKVQYSAMNLMRQVVHILTTNLGRKIPDESGVELMDRINHLANLLPKSEKSVEHLKRFFNHAHSDKAILGQLTKLTRPGCSCVQAANSMRELLKRLSPTSGSTGTSESQMNYARSCKVLLERSAPVLFDKDLGQELLTQLVLVREARSSAAAACRLDIVRGLRLLWALAVYFKKILPATEVLDYVITVMEESKDDTHEASLPIGLHNTTSSTASSPIESDPPAVQELALNILCCVLDGSSSIASQGLANGTSSDTDGTRDPRINPPIMGTEAHFAGSESHLLLRSDQLLPLLCDFCCHGLTVKCPPVPVPGTNQNTPSNPNGDSTSNATRAAKNKNAPPATDQINQSPANNLPDMSMYRAGLAWRRERRRAKLSARALICLYRIAHKSSSPRSKNLNKNCGSVGHKSDDLSSMEGDVDLDIDPEEFDETESLSEPRPATKFSSRVQRALDEVVEVCLSCSIDSAHYVTCLTSLSRIALLLPNVYNRQFKKLITKSLVQEVLVRQSTNADPTSVNTSNASKSPPKSGRNSIKARLTSLSTWLPDGCIPQITRAKISALKLMASWLRGLKNEVKPVAQAVIRLLHRIIIHEGDLTREGNLSPGEMSRMRLAAATAWLKLAHSQSYAEDIEVDWYQSMTYVICDPCPFIRSHFLTKLSQGLMCLRLPLEYMAMFAHAADVPDAAFKQRAKQLLASNVQRRRDFLARHPTYMNDAKFLYGLLPDFVLPYLIYLLSHDPEWTDPNDINRLTRIKSALWFVMEPIVNRGQNFTFLRKIIEKIKHTRDALAPEDSIANLKLYTACDIALGLLLTRCPSLTIKEYPVEVKLPRSLFTAAPASFRNPDFAQLLDTSENTTHDHVPPVLLDSAAAAPGKARIQFTPVKHSRVLKEGLMPLQLLKGKAPNPIDNKPQTQSETKSSPTRADDILEPVVQPAPTQRQQQQAGRPKTIAKKQTKLITTVVVSDPSVSSQISNQLVESCQPSTSLAVTDNANALNSPKKHTQIVLGTPEIESDN
ncbi:unnamed protein product, partial [Echinostoma caproni]|uniref:Condensin complex subunit 1 n=1 Tax=Echinostoma caproni TaxID=27848 RepID=A0A183AAT2_9TREM